MKRRGFLKLLTASAATVAIPTVVINTKESLPIKDRITATEVLASHTEFENHIGKDFAKLYEQEVRKLFTQKSMLRKLT